jgi:hypothetical protein
MKVKGRAIYIRMKSVLFLLVVHYLIICSCRINIPAAPSAARCTPMEPDRFHIALTSVELFLAINSDSQTVFRERGYRRLAPCTALLQYTCYITQQRIIHEDHHTSLSSVEPGLVRNRREFPEELSPIYCFRYIVISAQEKIVCLI